MVTRHETDRELFEAVRAELFTAVVGDVLDAIGLTRQFLPPTLKPIEADMIILGRAMPVLQADFAAGPGGGGPLGNRPFGLMFEALDDLRTGEVYVATGSSPAYALWGGLMSTRAIACGAAGAILDGYHRDTGEILRLGFPVASCGGYAQDQGPRGKVIDWRVPIEIGGVRIEPGDIVFADRDGCLVVPTDVADAAFGGAFEKVRGEQRVLAALEKGMSSAEAFRTFGIM